MRKLFALLLALMMMLGIAAMAEEKIVVAGVVFQDDQFMNMLSKGYRDAAAAAGVEVLTANTNNDQATEVELINTYLTQGVKGIAIAPLSKDASVAALRAADAQGMKVTLTNIDLNDAEFIVGGFSSNDKINCRLVGANAAEIIKAKFPDKKVKIAIVQFRALLPDQSTARVEGYFEALDEAQVDYEIVADQDAWMQDTALAAADAIITANPELDVIIAVNDGGTIGSAQAVVNAGKQEQILVFGHDGSEQIASMILDPNNPLQAVVAQDPYGQGYQAMTLLIGAIRGEDYSATKGKTTYLDGIVMSKTDLEGVKAWVEANK
ncbi:MAG TPA: substrate-binding domain-containing protein [Clostridia bacterium]|nr:substrate-binding domain-containing protein [Clostridia bacterium]